MKRERTYTANIYVGLHCEKPVDIARKVAVGICESYCKNGLCVSIMDTTFVHTDGSEPGLVIGLINYPRFPVMPGVLRRIARDLAELLKEGLEQERVSVVFPDETIMLEEDE